MATKKALTNNFKNHKVLVFDENQSITSYQVLHFDSDCIETEEHMFTTADALKVYDNTNHGFTFIYNCPTVALMEASNLKRLRRDKTIKNIMSYETEKTLDLMKLVPYVIAIVAIMF